MRRGASACPGGGLGGSRQQALLLRHGHRARAGVDAELAVDAAQVRLDRGLADQQGAGDLPVPRPVASWARMSRSRSVREGRGLRRPAMTRPATGGGSAVRPCAAAWMAANSSSGRSAFSRQPVAPASMGRVKGHRAPGEARREDDRHHPHRDHQAQSDQAPGGPCPGAVGGRTAQNRPQRVQYGQGDGQREDPRGARLAEKANRPDRDHFRCCRCASPGPPTMSPGSTGATAHARGGRSSPCPSPQRHSRCGEMRPVTALS